MPAAAAMQASGRETAASWRAIGTSVHLLVTEPRALGPARRLLGAALAALAAAGSRFRADSETGARDPAPQDGGGRPRPVRVSSLLAGALAVALRAARRTGGVVDPTVGGALSAAGYDRDFAPGQPDGPPGRLTLPRVPRPRQIGPGEGAALPAPPPGPP